MAAAKSAAWCRVKTRIAELCLVVISIHGESVAILPPRQGSVRTVFHRSKHKKMKNIQAIKAASSRSLGRVPLKSHYYRGLVDKFRDIVGTKLPLFPSVEKLRTRDFPGSNSGSRKWLKSNRLDALGRFSRPKFMAIGLQPQADGTV